MSTHLPFPLADFYDALIAKDLKEKLEPFIIQFRKKNIYIMYECVNRLIQIITNKSELPLMKFNALMATRYFFDTCEYPAIIFIEVFMLPIIYQIALQKYLKRSQQGIQNYFIDRGAENTKQIRRLGINYVQLAAQFIFNAAKVKPYRLIQNRQLKQDSNFVRTVKVLNNKGIQQPEKCIYFIPSYTGQTRKKYLKKLKHFAPEPYISFVISEYLEQINLNKKCDLEIKKLLMFGDSFLTSTMVEIIESELSNMSANFINKKKYLNLLNDLIRSGEIESIYLINTTDFLNQIADEIGKVRGNIGYQQGEYIYHKIQASKQEKKEFFIQFLRVIEIWAYCMPTNEDNQQSDVARIYNQLKKKNFIFPKNVILEKISKQMKQNLLLNQERNDTLMKIIDEDDRASSRNVGSYVSGKRQFKFHFPDYKQKTQYLEMDELQDRVFQAKRKIARLTLQKSQLQENINYLETFANDWEQDLNKLDIEEEDPHELQILVDQGDLCCEQFKLVTPIYELYKKGKINHDTFLQKIQFLQRSDQNSMDRSRSRHHQKSKSDVMNASIQHKLQASKHSNASNKIRKQIQNQYFAQYGHHFKREENDDKYSVKTHNQQKREQQNMSHKDNRSVQNYGYNKVNNQDKKGINIKQNNQKAENKSSNKQNQLAQSKHSQSEKSLDSHLKSSKNLKSNQNNKNVQKGHKQQINLNQNKITKKQSFQKNSQQHQQNVFSNPMKKTTYQKFQQNSPSQISSQSNNSQDDNKSSHRQKSALKKQNLRVNPYNIRQPTYQQQKQIEALQSSGSNFKIQQKKKVVFNNNQQKSKSKMKNRKQNYDNDSQRESPNKKSVIKHSVISKSSYHSQPTQQKITDSHYHQSGSVMNDYQIQIQNQGGMPTIKKSSIKRTQNSGMKNSSHKKINNNHYFEHQTEKNRNPPLVGQAVSPFKKKTQAPSDSVSRKQLKIKQSYAKNYEFIKQNKNQSRSSIDQNYAYQNVFKKNSNYQSLGPNDSQISSQSQSVIQKRNKKKILKQSGYNKIQLNDQSQYYNQETSILKRQKAHKLKMKTQQSSNTPSKLYKNKSKNNIILFDSSHHPQQNANISTRIQKINQQYDIKESKVEKYMNKIGEYSRNTQRFANSKAKNSGIKLVSRNQYKQFDSLYKNQHVNSQYEGESGMGSQAVNRYQEVTSQYKQVEMVRSKSPKNTNNFDFVSVNRQVERTYQNKASYIQNPDYGMVSAQQINQEIQKYKNRPKRNYNHDPQISQIHEPQNLPMLYSYHSQKSIHSKLTESHTPKTNNKSNSQEYRDFRSCYLNMDKQVLPLDLTRSKAVSGSFSLDKAQNFIEFRVLNQNSKSSSKVNTVVDAINQKNAKNSILLYKLQREKTRLVQNLQNKIKSLQMNGKMMKTKLAVKDQSVKQSMDRQNSQRDLKLNSRQVKNSRQSSNQNYSLSNYDQSKKNNTHNAAYNLNNNKVSRTQQTLEKYQSSQTSSPKKYKTLNTKAYFDSFFKSISKNQQTKKTIYKKKGILIKNEQIQVGYMLSKKDKNTILSVFITPQVSSIKNVVFQVQSDSNLAYKIKPGKYEVIEAKKQELVAIQFSVQNVPFKIPKLKLKFDGGRNYSVNSYEIDLPLTMLAFCEILEPNNQPNKNNVSSSQPLRTELFKCSKKLSSIQKVQQIFSSFKIKKQASKVYNLYGTIQYQGYKFNIELCLNDLGFATVQGSVSRSGSEQIGKDQFKCLEYLLSTIKLILQEYEGQKSNKK